MFKVQSDMVNKSFKDSINEPFNLQNPLSEILSLHWQAIYTGVVVLLLIITLYLNRIRPALVFLMSTLLLIGAGILKVEELLSGLANKQILVIFLLMVLTAGLQNNLGNGFFFTIFRKDLSPAAFRLRMMGVVAGISSLLNNTSEADFINPYIKTY